MRKIALFLTLPLVGWPVAAAQTYDELAAIVAGPWHHTPNPVSKSQLDRDDARCRVVAAQTPVNSTTPAVVARVRWTTQINCMKSLGYEPGRQAAAGEITDELRLRQAIKPETDALFGCYFKSAEMYASKTCEAADTAVEAAYASCAVEEQEVTRKIIEVASWLKEFAGSFVKRSRSNSAPQAPQHNAGSTSSRSTKVRNSYPPTPKES
jgi:hypothetical protein